MILKSEILILRIATHRHKQLKGGEEKRGKRDNVFKKDQLQI